jgi:hypothetical protein
MTAFSPFGKLRRQFLAVDVILHHQDDHFLSRLRREHART